MIPEQYREVDRTPSDWVPIGPQIPPPLRRLPGQEPGSQQGAQQGSVVIVGTMTTLTALPQPVAAQLSPTPAATAHPEVLHVVAWDDPVVEATGLDPRSAYVEMFWLPLLGPSATWLLRRLADGLQTAPEGFDLEMEEAACALGLGGVGGRRSPFHRAILRCTRYAVARHLGPDVLAVRRRVAPLPDRYVFRLPRSLQEQHRRWAADGHRAPAMAAERRRARLLALDLVILGEDRAGIERRLLRWDVHPALAYESAEWSSSRPAFDP
jgi:hypothetical protein